MGLADELANATDLLSYDSYQKCRVQLLWDLLDPQDREALRSLLGDPRVRGTRIVEFLRRYALTVDGMGRAKKTLGDRDVQIQGICSTISSATIQRHRRGACTCGELS